MRQSVERDERAKIKTAIIRLYELYERMQKIASKRIKSYGPSPLSGENFSEKDVEQRVRAFGETLANFLKLRVRTNATLAALGNSLKNLKKAVDVDEISTLIGLTLLSDREECNRNAATLRKYYEEQLEPSMPEILKVFKWVANLNDFGKWLDELINRDLTKKEDDFTNMITAIRDRDVDKFNEIYDRLEQGIEIEERK